MDGLILLRAAPLIITMQGEWLRKWLRGCLGRHVMAAQMAAVVSAGKINGCAGVLEST